MVGSFRSNSRMVVFLKQKKIMSQQTRKGPYIYDVNIEVGWVVSKFVECFQMQILLFSNKRSHCSFLQMQGVGGHTIGHIIGLNILKLQPVQ